jgi:hypothetical protein
MKSSLTIAFLLGLAAEVGCSTADEKKVDADADGIVASEDCDDHDETVGTISTWYADVDHDGFGDVNGTAESCYPIAGYSSDSSDCDDTRATVHPGAEEVCNSLDDNCDGTIDERIWWIDIDGDGYGDPLRPFDNACRPPPNLQLVDNDDDCDDNDPYVNPDAEERCNDIDDNCNGLVDDDPPDPYTWYIDADGDLYGDPTQSQVGCDQPKGYVPNASDCDDTNPTIRPYGAEIVLDGIDQDCTGHDACYSDLDGDGFGSRDVRDTLDDDCNDPLESANHEDCDDRNPDAFPDAEEVCDGVDNDCDGQADEEGSTGETIWYWDRDADGAGDPLAITMACDEPPGHSRVGTDCNDHDRSVHPGATEDCDEEDNNCDGIVDNAIWYADADGDGYGDANVVAFECPEPEGYTDDATDCNDGNARIHPRAAETTADGIDQDCDGGDVCWADEDLDGYGSRSTVTSTNLACTDSGESTVHTDCDDDDSSIWPGAEELCDGLDNDCDGSADEGTPADSSTWYLDADSDGFGNPASTMRACHPSTGYVADGTDCDDSHSSAYPGGSEICDGLDNDCNGVADDITWYADADGDGYGDDTHSAVTCSPAAGWVTTGGDCDEDDATINPGADEICGDDIDNNCDGQAWGCTLWGDYLSTEADAILTSSVACAGTSVHADVAGVGDVNLDGYDDLLVGVNADGCTTDQGHAYLVLGPVTGNLDLAASDASFTGEATGNQAGAAVAAAGDVNHDGYADLVIGAYGEDTEGSRAGAAYLVLGPVSGDVTLSSADAKYYGESGGSFLGFSVASAGDLDGDGYDDVVAGGWAYNDTDTSYSGAAWIFNGPTLGSVGATSADAFLVGSASEEMAGWSVGGAGDTNGDGQDDLLVGALHQSDVATHAGACYVLLGPVSGDISLSESDATLQGESTGDAAGSAVASAGDVNDDGYADVLVGAWFHDTPGFESGATYVVLGPMSGAMNLSSAEARLLGEATADYSGVSVAGAGDVDGDGHEDLLVGAWKNDETASDAGAAYLVFGPSSGTSSLADAGVRIRGSAASEEFGATVAGAGDVDGNGMPDIVIGSAPTSNASAYLFLAWLNP